MGSFFYAPGDWSRAVYDAIQAWGLGIGLSLPWIQFIVMVIEAIILVAFIFIDVMFLTWLERKVAGHIQVRLGPMRTGPHGLLQPVADAIKLLFKEPLVPPFGDRFIYFVSPLLMFTAAMLVFIAIPFAPGWVVAPLDYGVLFILGASGLSTIFVLVGGWCSNNKWSLLGGMRAVSLLLASEVPLILAVLGVVLVSGSLNLVEIVEGQEGMWNIVRQPLAFLIFFIASLAELNRGPFDLAEAEQELVAGYLTEYSGMHFAMYYLGEYTHLLAGSALVTIFFLGGWQGPWLPPILWFLIKLHIVAFIYMWVRWTFPRIRVDHLLSFNWKFLLPLALLNLGVTGLVLAL